MHQWIMSIGYGIIGFFQNMSWENLLTSLKILGTGMLGIFLVTGIIILVVTLLTKLFTPKQ